MLRGLNDDSLNKDKANLAKESILMNIQEIIMTIQEKSGLMWHFLPTIWNSKLKMEDVIPTWDCSEILMCKGTTKCMAYLRLLLVVLLLQTPTNVNHTLIINDISVVFTQLYLK